MIQRNLYKYYREKVAELETEIKRLNEELEKAYALLTEQRERL